MNGIRTAGVAYQPQTASVAFTEPPLSPPVGRPFAAVPVQAPVPVAAPAAPVAQVAPVPQPEPHDAPQLAAPQQPVQAAQRLRLRRRPPRKTSPSRCSST